MRDDSPFQAEAFPVQSDYRGRVMTINSAHRARLSSSNAASCGPISNALIRATRLHIMRARQLFQEVGLYPGQELLLMHLWDAGPQRQSDLAAKFDTDSASMTRTVQRLERAGFVRRLPDPTDRRATLVESTPAGTALRTRVEQLWAELEALTIGNMSPDRQQRLLCGLLEVEANLADKR